MEAWRIGIMEAETNYQPSTTATRRHSKYVDGRILFRRCKERIGLKSSNQGG